MLCASLDGRGGLGGEWIHVYVWLNPFTVLLRPSQHCYLAIPQYKLFLVLKNNKIGSVTIRVKGGWGREGMENKYPLGTTVAKSKGMELREEGRLDGEDLRVQLCRPGHGWRARQ